MVVAGRQKSIAFFISLGVGLIVVILLLYIGWFLRGWRTGILLFFGILLVLLIIGGIILNTIFLVREIRRNEQHDAFINAVTHELKTPIASIRLYLETLQMRPLDDQKRREFYQIMLDDSDRLLGTIEQVLRTGRLGSANRVANQTRIDIDQLIEETFNRARSLHNLPPEALEYQPALGRLGEGSGQSTADGAEKKLAVWGDLDEVRAAVSNLVDNAVKYSGRDVHVTVQTLTMEDRFVVFRVTDRGAGIPQAELKRIFRRFYRVPGSVAMRVKGTGLGLFIVRSVAKRHGGRAWAESAGPGLGSTFVLQLPMAR